MPRIEGFRKDRALKLIFLGVEKILTFGGTPRFEPIEVLLWLRLLKGS